MGGNDEGRVTDARQAQDDRGSVPTASSDRGVQAQPEVTNIPMDYLLSRGYRRRMKKELGLAFTPSREWALKRLLEAGKAVERAGQEKPVKVQRKAFSDENDF